MNNIKCGWKDNECITIELDLDRHKIYYHKSYGNEKYYNGYLQMDKKTTSRVIRESLMRSWKCYCICLHIFMIWFSQFMLSTAMIYGWVIWNPIISSNHWLSDTNSPNLWIWPMHWSNDISYESRQSACAHNDCRFVMNDIT